MLINDTLTPNTAIKAYAVSSPATPYCSCAEPPLDDIESDRMMLKWANARSKNDNDGDGVLF